MLVIDRFEGDFAVCECEDGKIIELVKSNLPFDIKEGDCLIEVNGSMMIDLETTAKKREEISKKMNKLFENK